MATDSSNILQAENIIQDFDMEVNEQWALDFIRRNLMYAKPLVDVSKLEKYRSLDLGEFTASDLQKLKEYFDPKNQETNEGGTAEYMRGGFVVCPLIHSLLNIIKKQIQTNVVSLSVKGSDKLSVDKKSTEKLRILNKRNMVDNINYVLEMSGYAPIEYNANLDKIFVGEGDEQGMEESAGLLEKIKAEAQDDFDYQVLEESGMLKDGVEISHEEMISHNIERTKFNVNISDGIISDYMQVQTLCYRYYTSAINGLPECIYVNPSSISTSPFQNKDASDMDYWRYIFPTTWSEYMKLIGGSLSKEQNKRVWEANRNKFGYGTNMNFDECYFQPTYGFLNTTIVLGYVELKKHVHDKQTNKYYDVWKKFYYIPLALSDSVENAKDLILGLGDVQDMYRHGTNLAYSSPSIIIRKDSTKLSFYDVMNVEFERMNKVYAQYINTFASFIPEGVIFNEESIRALADEIIADMQQDNDETNAETATSIQAKIIRRVKQSGSMVAKKRKGDDDEERLDNPTSVMENKILIDCAGLIQNLMTLYNMMLMSLGINPNRLAQEPKPRTTDRSIQGATSQSAFATMDIEEAYEFALTSFGERQLYYDQQVITEFNKKLEPLTDRAKEMAAVIGRKGVNWLEVYNDMPAQRCILQVEEKPSEADKMLFLNYVNEKENLGLLPPGTLLMAQSIENFKLAKLFVNAVFKRTQRIQIENQQALQAQQQQAAQQAFQMQQQAVQAEKEQDAGLEARLKTLEEGLQTQGKLRAQDNSAANKKEIADHEAALEQATKQTEALL